VIACCASSFVKAGAPGPTGLINMPDARFDPDGTLRFGMASAPPYFNLTANATLLPWLETNLGVTRINGVPGFSTERGGFGAGYGAYKDKTSGLKVRLIAEEGWWPSVAVGAQDPIGTRLFERQGLILVEKDKAPEDKLFDIVVEAGAEDLDSSGEYYAIKEGDEVRRTGGDLGWTR